MINPKRQTTLYTGIFLLIAVFFFVGGATVASADTVLYDNSREGNNNRHFSTDSDSYNVGQGVYIIPDSDLTFNTVDWLISAWNSSYSVNWVGDPFLLSIYETSDGVTPGSLVAFSEISWTDHNWNSGCTSFTGNANTMVPDCMLTEFPLSEEVTLNASDGYMIVIDYYGDGVTSSVGEDAPAARSGGTSASGATIAHLRHANLADAWSNSGGSVSFQLRDDDDWVPAEGPCPLDLSCFYDIIPQNNATTSTSSQLVGFSAFVSESEYSPYGYFNYRLYKVATSLGDAGGANNCASIGCLFTGASEGNLTLDQINVDIPFTSFGDFDWSTTTSFARTGGYNVDIKYVVPDISILGINIGSDTVISSYTRFRVGGPNAFDRAAGNFIENIIGIVASTTADVGEACTPLSGSFSIGNCVTRLVIPTPEGFNDSFTILRATPPWGYAFRFYDIISNNATTSTTSLPVISYTSGTSSIFGATTFDFDPFGTLLEADSIVNAVSDQEDPKTVWEIFEPIIYVIVYLALLLLIIKDLFGIVSDGYDPALDIYKDLGRDKVYHQRRRYYDQIHKITRKR